MAEDWVEIEGEDSWPPSSSRSRTVISVPYHNRVLEPTRTADDVDTSLQYPTFPYRPVSLFKPRRTMSHKYSPEFLKSVNDERLRWHTNAAVSGGIPMPEYMYTEPLEKAEQCSCTKPCNVDHGKERYARSYSGATSRPEELKVKEDTGTSSCWIHPDIVAEFEMPVYNMQEPQPPVHDFNNTPFHAKQFVQISLTGRSPRSIQQKFYLAPKNCPARAAIVGSVFIQEHGHPHELFYEQSQRGEMLVLVHDPSTESECDAIKQRRAEAALKRIELAERKKKAVRAKESGSSVRVAVKDAQN